ncbi:hypothetical protein [Actinomadura graeca]|nr:hypothetical protein [Actinomadura graeca]
MTVPAPGRHAVTKARGRLPLAGLVRYEGLMLLRRPSSLVVVALIALVLLIGFTDTPRHGAAAVAGWANLLMYVVPIGVGVLLSDRLVRERDEGLGDLLNSTPVPPWRRAVVVVAGSFAGPYTLVAGTLLAIGAVHSVLDGGPEAFGAALLLAVAMILPGLLVATAVASLLALLMPLPAARVLLVAFWLWACMLNPNVIPIPSTTGTLLSPLGEYVAISVGGERSYQGLGLAPLSPDVTAGTAALSAAALVLAALALMAAALVMVNRNRLAAGYRWE